MKDQQDPGTKDAFPMTNAERQRKRRLALAEEGRIERTININAELWDKFVRYCNKEHCYVDNVLALIIENHLQANRRGTR